MRSSRVALMTVRATGLLLIVLGALFWAGRARSLIPVHMLLGLILVLALWMLGVQAARAGAGTGFVLFTAAWGLAVLVLGMVQTRIAPGALHWTVQALHLVVGLAAMGLAEGLARRIRVARSAASA